MPISGLNEEYCREHWGPLVSRLNERIKYLERENDDITKELARLSLEAEKGRAFQKMLDEVNENTLTKAAWGKFLMSLRMVEDVRN